MNMAKRRLPVLVEHSVGQIETLRVSKATHFDSVIREEVKNARLGITCSAGCASCCYHPIAISILEAVPIYRSLVRHGKWNAALKKRLKDTGTQQLGMAYQVWLLALIPCPLLTEDKRCSAYEERPFVCRTLYSVGDPYFCHPHRLGSNTQLVPRDGTLAEFHDEQAKILHHHHLRITTIPIGMALLLAEQLCQGTLELNDVDGEVMKEFEVTYG